MQLLGYIISSFGPLMIQLYGYERLMHRRAVSKRTVVFAFLTAAVLLTIQPLLLYNVRFNSLVNIVLGFLLTFFYQEVWYHRLFISFALFVSSVLAEGSGWIVGRMLFPVDSMSTVNELVIFPIMCVLGVLFDFLYAWIIVHSLKLFERHKQKISTLTLFLIAVLIFCIIDLLVTFADTAHLPLALVLVLLLIASIAGCLYLFNDQLKVQRERLLRSHLEQQLHDQVAHYATLYQTNQEIAVLKHDLKNILLNIQSYIQLGHYDQLGSYVHQFQQKIQPSALIDNGMPFIDAVLSAKITEHDEIDFAMNISMLQLEHLDQAQIATILAIALDNAIEACAGCDKPYIELHLAQQGKMISLVMRNSSSHPVRSIGDMLLTTKSNPQEHGYGLKSMKHIAAQNNGMVTWDYQDERFSLNVLLQDLPPVEPSEES